jgi:hypothetical protein
MARLDAAGPADGVDAQFFVRALFCAISTGGLALAMSGSAGLSRTGTFKCISTLAAAEEAMALPVGSGGGGVAGSALVVTLPVDGMVMFSPQEGHLICVPAPVLSTASSWSQFGQLKMMSIIFSGVGCQIDFAPAYVPFH